MGACYGLVTEWLRLGEHRGLLWKRYGDGAAGAVVVGCRDASPHGFHEALHQGKADSRSFGGAGEIVVHPIEVVEDLFERVAWDAWPGVGHPDHHPVPLGPHTHRDLPPRGALAELDAVVDQVDEHLNHHLPVVPEGAIQKVFHGEREPFLAEPLLHGIAHFGENLLQ